jgi:P27 family predicted phage terminase small subunit
MPRKKPVTQLIDQRPNRLRRRTEIAGNAGDARPVPLPPRGLLPVTRKRWREYFAAPVSQAIDLQSDIHAVERFFRLMDEYERCLPVFQEQRLVEGSMGQPALNPLGAYLNQLQSQMNALGAQLGMTPLGRLRLGLTLVRARESVLDRYLDRLNRRGDVVELEDTPEARHALYKALEQ